MAFISIFNDVLGPVMRGPSSSHTAGAHRIGLMVRDLLDAEPTTVLVTFDPDGSMAPTWQPLGVDLAFTAGIMGWSMLDERYFSSVDRAQAAGATFRFEVAPLEDTDHPNGMLIEVASKSNQQLRVVAEAVGGGGVRIVRLDHWALDLDGKSHVLLVEVDATNESAVADLVPGANRQEHHGSVLLSASSTDPFNPDSVSRVSGVPAISSVRTAAPVFYVRQGRSRFESAEEMVAEAEDRGLSLGEIALAYESELLGLTEDDAIDEMLRRFAVMEQSVAASSAFTCADLILGGYTNPIPLDESIDASYEVGKALPSALRCTARGGCAVTPSALRLARLR